MDKIKVEICVGTTCFVLGASALQDIEMYLPEELKDKVEITGANCLGMCKNSNFGDAPFVRINESIIVSQATIDSVIAEIKKLVK